MVKAVDPDKIPITSTTQLTTEFSLLLTALAKEETEHTWEQIDKALKRFQAVIRGGACKFTDDFVRQMRAKEVVVGIVRSMETERTRLSATTLLLLSSLTRLGPSFAPLLPLFLPPLLRLLCRTNKLYLSRAASTLSSIVVHTRLPEILKFVVGEWKAEGGKSASYRTGATAVVLSMLEGGEEMAVEKDGIERRMDELEWVIRTGATDKEQKVRAEIKKVWERYKREWPERVAGFTAPMTPVIRRYLAISGVAAPSSSIPPRAAAPLKKPKVPTALLSHPPVAAKSLASSVGSSKSLSASVGASKSASSSTHALSKSVSASLSTHTFSKSVSGPSTHHALSTSTSSSSSHPVPTHALSSAPPLPRPHSSRPSPPLPPRAAFAPSRPLHGPIEKRKPQRFVPPPPVPAKAPSTNALSRSTNAPSRTTLARSTTSRPPVAKATAPTDRSASNPVARTAGPFRPTSSAKIASRSVRVERRKEEVPLPGEDSVERVPASVEVDLVLEARLDELVRCLEGRGEESGRLEGGTEKGLMEESMMMGEHEGDLVQEAVAQASKLEEELVEVGGEDESSVQELQGEVVKPHEDLVDIAFVNVAESNDVAIEEELAQVEEELAADSVADEPLVEEDALEFEEELLEAVVEERDEEEHEVVANFEAFEEDPEGVAEVDKELVEVPIVEEALIDVSIIEQELVETPIVEEQLVELEEELLEASVEEEREMVAKLEEAEQELAVVEEVVIAQEIKEEAEIKEELEAVDELIAVEEPAVVAQEIEEETELEEELELVEEEFHPSPVQDDKELATAAPPSPYAHAPAPSSPSPARTFGLPPSPTFNLPTPPLSTQSFVAQMAPLSPEPFHTCSIMLDTPPLRPSVHLPFSEDTSSPSPSSPVRGMFLPDEAEMSFEEEEEEEERRSEFEVPLNDAEDSEEDGEGWVDEMAPTVIFESRLAPEEDNEEEEEEEEEVFGVDASELRFDEEAVEEEKRVVEEEVEEVVVLKRSLRNREVVVEVGRTPAKTPSRRSVRDVLGEVQL